MREMKDSGVAWIGAVPSDYRTASIGSLFTIKKDIIGREPETVLSITQTGIRPKDLSSNEGQNASSYAHYQIVNVGDFAMNHMDLLTGWIDISKYEGVTSPDYRVFTLNDKEMSADYFLRVFQYYYTNKVFFGFGQGVATLGRWRLPAINFKKIDVPVPPVLEQQRIVSAIDEKVGKVDALIANVQAQIEKLKDYKQSVITEVVTKGLDPAVPMKDSGIEWIGKIAETHTIFRLKYLLDSPMQYGANESGDKFVEDSVRYIRITDITADGKLKNDENNQYLPLDAAGGYILKDKDVLFARSGGTVGKSFLYQEDYGTSAFAGYLIKAECDKSALLPEYLIYYSQSSLYELWKNMIFIQATIQNIGANKYSNMEIPVPSIDEQATIVEYLEGKCAQIDRLIAIKQAKIEKLEQYKRSLIYEYVTGKREVS